MKPTVGGYWFGGTMGGLTGWWLHKSGIVPNSTIAEQNISANLKTLRVPSHRVVITGMLVGAVVGRISATVMHGPDPNPWDDDLD